MSSTPPLYALPVCLPPMINSAPVLIRPLRASFSTSTSARLPFMKTFNPAARPVVSEGQMLPIVVVERFSRANDDRVVGPGGDQPDGQRRGPSLDVYQMRLLNNQFVPAPRLLVFDLLESEIVDLAYSGAHPEREGKSIASVERAGVAETQHSLAVQ